MMENKNTTSGGDLKLIEHQNRKPIVLPIFIVLLFLAVVASTFYHFIAKKTPKTSANSNTVSQIKVVSKPLKSQTVCIDPGHGGSDPGAIYGQVHEADINLTVAEKVKTILEGDDYQVYMTRTSDVDVEKRSRSIYCNSQKATIMVSIHHNSYDTDNTVNYATALYYKDADVKLASSILSAVSDQMGVQNQGIAKFDNSLFWVATMPSAMSEAFFITDNTEYNSSLDPNSTLLDTEAKGIVKGIENYFDHPDQIPDASNNDSLVIDRTDLGN